MEATAAVSTVNPFRIAQWVLLGIGTIIVVKFLNKFNLLGTSRETQEAIALGQDAALAQTTQDIVSNPNNPFLLAIKKKFGSKPTPKQMASLLPNKPRMPKLITQINDAHNTFTFNDASKIFAAFRGLASQYEVNFFATLYSATTGQDMYGKLDDLMRDKDMATLRQIINSKPLV